MNKSEWKDILVTAGLDANTDFRPEQFEGACAIDDVFLEATSDDRRSLLLEAPTGIGKTLMYLGTLLGYNNDEPTVVSTSGKLLQHQIARSAEKLGINSIVLMGRSNYLCRTACLHYLKNLPEDHKFFPDMKKLCGMLNDGRVSHELQEILKSGWENDFRNFICSNLTASSSFCRNGHDGEYDGCTYTELYQTAKNTPLLILNHHAMFSIGKSDLFENRILAADEAHTLPDAAASILSTAVSTLQLRSLQQRADLCRDTACQERVKSFKGILENIISVFTQESGSETPDWLNFQQQVQYVPKQPFTNDILSKCTPLCRDMLREINDTWSEICDFITNININSADGVYFFETSQIGKNQSVSLKYSPIEISGNLHDFWNQWRGTIGLSATLTLPGAEKNHEFDYFIKSCGFPVPDKTLCLNSPFDFNKQCKVFVPAQASVYDSSFENDPERFLKERLLLTGSMIHVMGGRTLSLYTASSRLEGAACVLKKLFPSDVLAQGIDEVDNDELAQTFIDDAHKVLLGTKSFFQGFDAPGETLSCEILEKLPFRYKNDPVLTKRAELEGQDGFRKVILPAMLMELRQAFGRLIRNTNDKGIFILTDRRFIDKNYKTDVEQALSSVKINFFTSPQDLVSKLPKDFFPFVLREFADFEKEFLTEWENFRESDLFRRITGLKSLTDIQKKMGIPSLRQWQKEIIDNVINGVQAQFVIYPAGSGKSLTYQLPALMRPGLTLVISPLKSLMYDQVQSLRNKGFYDVDFLNSSLNITQISQVLQKIEHGQTRLLYVAPERLHKSFINKILYSKRLSMLVIDEAHMISQAGSNWRPFYGELRQAWETFGKPQLLALTATAGENIRRDICRQFDIPDEFVFSGSVIRPRVRISVNPIQGDAGYYSEARKFTALANGKPVLIYCSTIKNVNLLYRDLTGIGIKAAMYYTGKDKYNNPVPDTDLEKNHQNFLNGNIQVMIATNAYGMGIDKADIWGVLFNNVPVSLEEFVQGAGRICRNKKILDQYCSNNHIPRVSVTYSRQDLIEQQDWKVTGSFKKIKANIDTIINDLTGTDNSKTVSCAYPGYAQLDEDKLCACILLMRCIRLCSKKYSHAEYRFDWLNSEFVFPFYFSSHDIANEVKNVFCTWLDNLEQTQKNQITDVQNFCESSTCRNAFLDTYFSGIAAGTKCYCCDKCRYDLAKHDEYINNITTAFDTAEEIFTNGQFNGDIVKFLDFLDSIKEEQLAAQIAYLHKEHRESLAEYSDANFAASLLSMRQNGLEFSDIFDIFADLAEMLPGLKDFTTKKNLLIANSIRCKIDDPENLLTVLKAPGMFIKKYKNTSVAQVTGKMLADCKKLSQQLLKIEKIELRRELYAHLKRRLSDPYFADLVIIQPWRAAVGYVLGNCFTDILIEHPTEKQTEHAEYEWETLKKYLDYINNISEKNPEKYRVLLNLTELLVPEQKREWQLILSAPQDYLHLDSDEDYHQWFCSSPAAESKFLHCRVKKEDMVIFEADAAQKKMPVANWQEVANLLPAAVKFYPEFSKLLQYLQRENLPADFFALLPQEHQTVYKNLPFPLKYLLEKKLRFNLLSK